MLNNNQNSLNSVLRKLRILLEVSQTGLKGYNRLDLLNKFDMTDITFKRDLCWIRAQGINIHSCNYNVILFTEVDLNKLNEIINTLENPTKLIHKGILC
ncbi:MAG: hypothetical protein EHM58_06615 [Ignavibacteriae bacterium]|nr:MAG: hypothetical protein EHM58_06615 [Ignavibacteriota bacterium]